MPGGYHTHADYIKWVEQDAAARRGEVLSALRHAFSRFIELREIEVVNFSTMTAMDLARAIAEYPLILKALLAACNVAGRAVERDLDIRNLDTYRPRLDAQGAAAIAGYLKPFLPQEVALPALGELDRYLFVDKQIRMIKGQWEKQVREAIDRQTGLIFKKRKFTAGDEQFELDAAAPPEGAIEVAVDVKRIEARRDIHKRCDEIVNKAAKFKQVYPNGRFAAVVYYPFTAEHVNVQHRLESTDIDAVVFGSQSEEQLQTAVGLLVDRLGIRKR